MNGDCFLKQIDRKNDYYRVRLHLNSRNTLLDGELVTDTDPKTQKTYQRFLAFDLLILAAQSMVKRPFRTRIGYLKQELIDPYRRSEHPEAEFSFELKRMEFAYGMDKVWASIPQLWHDNDGLIFTAVHSQYTIGTCEAMLKWKPPSMNSIDFRVSVLLFIIN